MRIDRIKKCMAVFGSRTITDKRAKIILLEEIILHSITEIVTAAEPEGVCNIARALCKEKAIPLKLHFLNFKYLKGAFEHRSIDTLKDCDRAVFIHDGESKGTANELKLANKMLIPYTYHKLEKSETLSIIGLEEMEEFNIED